MSNAIYIAIVTFFIIVISWFSYELGIAGIPADQILTNPVVGQPEAGLWQFLSYVFGVLSAFFQIMTFRSEMPHVINAFFFTPMAFSIFFIIVTIIRGGAR